MAANIGATALSHDAHLLEQGLRCASPDGEEALAAHAQAVLDRLETLLRGLSAWRLAAAELPAGPGSAMAGELAGGGEGAAQAAVERLRCLLAADDPAALDFLLQQTILLRGALGAGFVRVEAHVRDFDFEQALALIGAPPEPSGEAATEAPQEPAGT